MVFFEIFILANIFSFSTQDNVVNNKTFPKNFMFGVATASYQVEGGWNEDGKGENIWDRLTHTRSHLIRDKNNGDIACDSYHKYKEDVTLLKELGVDCYRFSLSWSRILPTGFSDKINQAGVAYYKNLIRELKRNKIKPFVTIYHWDLPQPLQDAGGWPNKFIIDAFAEYARICFELFGEDVKYWTTFNEPKQVCQQGYGSATMAPAVSSPGVDEYLCAHNLLKAHAATWHIYDKEFRPTQNGKIGIVVDSFWWEPATNSTEDEIAAKTKREFVFGWYANPIFHGDYPEVMKRRVAKRSQKEGFNESRLPAFTQEDINRLKGTYDYLGLNFYTASLIKAADEPNIGKPSWYSDTGVEDYQPSRWEETASDWLKVTPWGIRKLLKWVKDNYNHPEILITECGVSDNGTSDDPFRIKFYRDYLSNVRDAMEKDGVNVTGFIAWSLIDNFEWFRGFTEKFGLYRVDFNSINRTRTPKKSAEYFKKVIKTHCLVDICENYN